MGLNTFPDDSGVYLCVFHLLFYCNGLAHSECMVHVFIRVPAMIDKEEELG